MADQAPRAQILQNQKAALAT